MSDREYPTRPFVGIGIVVIKDDQVLLCQRGKPPNLGSWTLPGGAQDLGETCEEAARRELMEECGLVVGDLHFCAHVDTIRRDDDGRIRFHYTILDFAARWVAGEPVAATPPQGMPMRGRSFEKQDRRCMCHFREKQPTLYLLFKTWSPT